ncbi:hypothetical protein, partial [Chelatococcus composti]|uniref:hypothetical protein n=1 Tax=Chelatococcus composti TaxID=1743235 RepID=UPI0035714257
RQAHNLKVAGSNPAPATNPNPTKHSPSAAQPQKPRGSPARHTPPQQGNKSRQGSSAAETRPAPPLPETAPNRPKARWPALTRNARLALLAQPDDAQFQKHGRDELGDIADTASSFQVQDNVQRKTTAKIENEGSPHNGRKQK